jgi:hypothetical protein
VLTVDEEEVEWAGKPATRWYYRIAPGIDPSALDSEQISSRFVSTYPQPPEEETPGAHRPTDISGTDAHCPVCGKRLSPLLLEQGRGAHPSCEERAA